MPKLNPANLKKTAGKIKLALMDIDGVLTDGRLYHLVDTAGALVEFKGVHSQDSISLVWLAECGIRTGFISGRVSKGMEERLKMLKASFIYQGRLDKQVVFDGICRETNIEPKNILYIGDDLPDIPVLSRVGLAVAVANARPEVKKTANWVTQRAGGNGAVREVAELVLKSQNLWESVLRRFVDTGGALR